MEQLTFSDEIISEPINVPLAALLFAREIAYPDLDVGEAMARIEELVDYAEQLIAPYQTTIEQAETLVDFLFIQERFQGNSQAYTDPRNSYLNEVLERRLGIPISLSVLYIAVAQRLGIPAQGIGLPGHFIVNIPAEKNGYYLDPFYGGSRLSREDCASLVHQSTGYNGPLQPDWLQPVSPRAILTRMLNNLRSIYFQQETWSQALAVVEHLRLLQPDIPDLLRDTGIIHHQQGSLSQAVHNYEQYLTRAPDAPDIQAVRSHLESAVRSLALLN